MRAPVHIYAERDDSGIGRPACALTRYAAVAMQLTKSTATPISRRVIRGRDRERRYSILKGQRGLRNQTAAADAPANDDDVLLHSRGSLGTAAGAIGEHADQA
jgi:hypothetical protein